MTTVIDERVVEMRFNNEDFEKNVAQSMSTLNKLKDSLNFDSAESLASLGKAAKGFNLDGISEAVTTITSKFSALEIAGITAISKITSAAMDMGVGLARSLSVDQITMGFDKYATKTQAVQTIIAATGEEMEKVTEQIDRLNWFTDETSYNLVDMTANIAKFTSNGVKLDDAVTQMIGIANATALAGGNAEKASHAMMGFSKAYAEGAMKKQQWNFIQTANIDTMQLKQTLIDAAVELGTLKKVTDDYYETLNGKEVTVTNFEEQLKQGWMSREVMAEALDRYGRFSQVLYDSLDKLKKGVTTSEVLDYLEEYKNGTIDLNEAAEELGTTAEDLDDIMKTLSSAEMELSEKAFRAGQEAKTFAEAIDSVKDAVSTGWMKTFEYMFGNYEEAKVLWTGLANTLYDAFAEGGNTRNSILSTWRELGGREGLIYGLAEGLNLLLTPLQVVKDAFNSFFPDDIEDRARNLLALTNKFRAFMEGLRPSNEELQKIYTIFQGIFSIGKMVAQVFTAIVKAIFPIARPFGSLLDMVLTFLSYVGAFFTAISRMADQLGIFEIISNSIAMALNKVISLVGTAALLIGGGLVFVLSNLATVVATIVDAVSSFAIKFDIVGKVTKVVKGALAGVAILFGTLFGVISNIVGAIGRFISSFNSAKTAVGGLGTELTTVDGQLNQSMTALDKFRVSLGKVQVFFSGIVKAFLTGIKTISTNFINFFKTIGDRFRTLTAGATSLKDYFTAFVTMISDGLTKIIDFAKEFFGSFNKDGNDAATVFQKITDVLKKFLTLATPGRIVALGFAAAMLGLTSSMLKLSDQFKGVASSVSGVFNNINKLIKKQFSQTSVITDLAKAFALLAGSLALLTFVDQDDLEHTAKVMANMIGVFTVCVIAIEALNAVVSIFAAKHEAELIATASSILAVAGAMLILSVALAALNKVTLEGSFKDWAAKLGIVAVLLAELGVLSVVVSRFAPKMGKGAILMLSLALSMKIMIDAIAVIAEMELDNLSSNIDSFAAILLSLAAVVFASSKIDTLSALKLILVVRALSYMFPEIVNLIKSIKDSGILKSLTGVLSYVKKVREHFQNLITEYGAVWGNLQAFLEAGAVIGGLAALAAFVTAVGGLGKLFAGLGVAAIGLALGLKILGVIIDDLDAFVEKSTPARIAEISSLMWNMMSGMAMAISIVAIFSGMINGALMMLTKTVDKKGVAKFQTFKTNFASMALAFVGMGAGMVLLSAALDIIAGIQEERIMEATRVLGTLMILLGICVGAAGFIKKGISAVLVVISVIGAVAVLIGELVAICMLIEDNPAGMETALLYMAGIFGMLDATLIILAVIATKASKALSAAAIVGTISIYLGVILLALTQLAKEDWNTYVPYMIGLTLVLGALVGVIGAITSFSNQANAEGMRGIFKVLLLTMGFLAEFALAVIIFNGLEIPYESVWHTIGALSVGLIAVAGAASLMMWASKSMGSSVFMGQQIVDIIKPLLIALFEFGLAVAVFHGMQIESQYVWDTIISLATGVAAIAGSVALIAHFSNGIMDGDKIKNLLKILRPIVISLFAFGAAVAIFKYMNIEMDYIKTTVISLAGGVAAMAGIVALLGTVVAKNFADPSKISSVLTLMILITGQLVFLSIALIELAKVGAIPEDVWSNMETIMTGLGLMNLIVVGLSAFVRTLDAKTIGATIAIMVLTCAELATMAYSLYKLAEIDTGKLQQAAATMEILAGVLTGLAVVGAAVSAGLAAVFSAFLGPEAGGLVGIAIIPGILLSISAAALSLGLGLKMGAEGIEIATQALTNLVPVIQQLSDIGSGEIFAIFTNLTVGFAEFGVGGSIGAIGAIALAIALNILNQPLSEFITIAQDLQNVDMGGIALGLIEIGAAGAIIGVVSPAIVLGALALNILTASLERFSAVMEGMESAESVFSSFFGDLGSVFSSGAALAAVDESYKFGEKIGGEKGTGEGFVGGMSDATGWASPPQCVIDFLDAVGNAFGMNQQAVADAAASGSEVGASWGENVANSAWPYVESIFSWFKGGGLVNPFAGSITTKLGTTYAKEQVKNFKNEVKDAGGVVGYAQKKIGDLSNSTGGFGGVLDSVNNVIKENASKTWEAIEGSDFYKSTVGEVKEIMEQATESANGLGEGFENAGSGASKGAKGVKEFSDSLASTLEGQLDIFSKFEIKTETSAQTMLDNMKSNIDGFASWSHRMTVLAERFAEHGIDKGLYQKLAELGPKGYDTMNAFYQMSEEQLDEVRDLYATSLTLPEGQADIVGAGFTYMGEMAVQGFSNALDDHKRAHEAAHGLGDAALDGMKEALDSHSPSKETEKIGKDVDLGLKNGIVDYQWYPKLVATNMATGVMRAIKKVLDVDKMKALGLQIGQGLAEGIKESEKYVVSATTGLLGSADKTVVKKEIISSPSKAWAKFGSFMGQGMGIGIIDAASTVKDAVETLLSESQAPLDGALDTIANYMGDDFSIVITPILDLSYLQQQLNEVNGMFADREFGVATFGQNEGEQQPIQQISYTQNNYSPKSLSRIDIYRSTNNQLSRAFPRAVTAN